MLTLVTVDSVPVYTRRRPPTSKFLDRLSDEFLTVQSTRVLNWADYLDKSGVG